MASTTTNYQSLSPTADDSDSSPTAHLLSTSIPISIPRSGSLTLHFPLTIRIFSSILTLTSFIIFVIDGGDAFIAANIFLMLILIHNVLLVIHYSISNVFKITVELRSSQAGDWSRGIGSGPSRLKMTVYFDLGFTTCLAFCLLVGNICQNRWHGGAWRAAVVLGWLVVGLQILLFIPGIDNKSLTLTAKFNDMNDKSRVDLKSSVLPIHEPVAVRSAAATPDSERFV